MFRVFKHYVPHAVLLLALFDFMLLVGAAELAWVIRARQIGMFVDPAITRLVPLLSFALSLQFAMIAVGVYGVDSLQSLRFASARLLVAICLGVIFLSVVYFAIPGATLWRSNSLYAMGIAYVFLDAVGAGRRFLAGADIAIAGFGGIGREIGRASCRERVCSTV